MNLEGLLRPGEAHRFHSGAVRPQEPQHVDRTRRCGGHAGDGHIERRVGEARLAQRQGNQSRLGRQGWGEGGHGGLRGEALGRGRSGDPSCGKSHAHRDQRQHRKQPRTHDAPYEPGAAGARRTCGAWRRSPGRGGSRCRWHNGGGGRRNGGDECPSEITGGLEAFGWLLGQGPQDHLLDHRFGVGDRRHRLVDVLEHHGDGRLAVGGEGRPPGEHLVEHHAQGIDVRACVDRSAARLLRAHVGRGSEHIPRCGLRSGAGDVSDAEVGQDWLDVRRQRQAREERRGSGAQDDVRRLHVAMDDPLGMGVIQRQGQIGHQSGDGRQRQGQARGAQFAQVHLERLPFEQFHDDVRTPVHHVEVVHMDDVGVPQGGDRLGFGGEAPSQVLVFTEVRVEDLDRHRDVERRVPAEVDLGHAPAPERLLEDDLRQGPAGPFAHG